MPAWGQKERSELGGEAWKGILGTWISVHRTSVLQEHSGACGRCEAAGIPQGEVQGGGMRRERRQRRSRGP